jgi:hypothetical protein
VYMCLLSTITHVGAASGVSQRRYATGDAAVWQDVCATTHQRRTSICAAVGRVLNLYALPSVE